ncbi:RNA polymerase sigma-70 factor, ECF subfamily [Parapedobacter composti]|uniref:RNA polymerase sigma-70 factor, ECF subfamily n=1 Tax=Parapedobacter composti TaxID=623281 RepID=A0A1I1JTK3_9SPHI|nr:sigma-70 family RNA polymerase sigma factor [Parapedobacter composti]SFC51705.1 RNA polymerase sigma-70 factor, ECF subfamily [Parapedobacter composti]
MDSYRRLKPNQETDLSVIEQLRRGNEAALSQLFDRYNRRLLYFARGMVGSQEVAEELVSDSFVKLWKIRANFETTDNVKAFLYITIKHACLNHVKSAHAQRHFNDEGLEELLSRDPDTYVRIVRAELMEAIHREVMRLPEKQREVFRLTYYDELDTDEICRRLDMSANAVFANRSRAVETLRKLFKDNELWLCLLMLQELVKHGVHVN